MVRKGEEFGCDAPAAKDDLKRRAKEHMMEALHLLDKDGTQLLSAAKLQEALDILVGSNQS